MQEERLENLEAVEPVAEAPVKKKKGKGLLITAVAVVLAAALGVGGWFGISYWQDSQAYEQAQQYLAENKYERALALFESLGDFKDAAQQTTKLKKLQEDYDLATKYLEEGKYSEAQGRFVALEDYRDSKQCASYTEAHMALTAAEDAAGYVSAGKMFEQLGDFKDSAAMVSASYLQAAHAAVEAGDDPAEYLTKLSEEDLKAFESSYHDAEVLEGLEEAFQLQHEMMQGYDFDNSEELELLEDLTELACKDQKLMELTEDYLEVLQQEQDNLDEYNYWLDYMTMFELQLERSLIVDELNERYGFLEENEELKEFFVGNTEHFEKCVAYQEYMDEWYEDVELREKDGEDYLVYESQSGDYYMLYLTIYYLDEEGKEISVNELEPMHVTGKMEIWIGMDFPEGAQYWDLAYSFDFNFPQYEDTTEEANS